MKIKRHYFLLILIIPLLFSLFIKKIENNKAQNWKFFIKEQIGAKSELNIGKNLSFDENSIYFSDGKDTIYSLNKINGDVNWLSKINNHSPFQVTIDKNFVYVASFDSHIYCLDKKNGYIVWSFAIPNQFWPDTEVVFDENDSSVFFSY